MRKSFLLLIILCMLGAAMSVMAGGQPEAPPERTAVGPEPTELLPLPVARQAHYNMSDYGRVSGTRISEFSEAPMLAERVRRGELPRVEQRLPSDPVVVVPFREVGRHGGTITLPAMNPNSLWPASQGTTEYFFTRDMRYPDVLLPSIATGYEFNDDDTVLTIRLREGLKWSDGAPFSADDVIFWWEDYILNRDVMPTMPPKWTPGGEPMTVEKIDQHTVRYSFAIPYPTVIFYFAQWANQGMQSQVFLPRHILENLHIEYNNDADALAQENGFDHWWELFIDRATFARDYRQFPDMAYMGPWIPRTVTEHGVTWERNPYYFKIDIEGNQLPYIDVYRGLYYDNFDLLRTRAIAGDYDYVPFGLSTGDMPVLADSSARGNYHTIEMPGVYGAECGIFVNNNYVGDADEAAILAHRNFKQALSLAINRDELNEVIAFGQAVVTQAAIDPNAVWFRQRWADAYVDYDPERANQLLDDMGMNRRDREGFRLMPNGRPFTLTPEFPMTPAAIARSAELIKEYWDAIGIRTNMRLVDYGTMGTRITAGEVHISAWPLDGVDAIGTRLESGVLNPFRPSWTFPLYYRWVLTQGGAGVEPPAKMKEYIQFTLEKPYVSDERFDRMIIEILDWAAEDMSTIGTIGYMPMPVLVRNGLGNVDAITVFGFSHPADGTKSHRPEVFFWREQ